MKQKIEIKNRCTGNVLFDFEIESNSTKKTLAVAIKAGADLSGADLSGADLSDANLSGADLSDAYLSGAYLRGKKIKKAAVFTGLYEYVVIPYITEHGDKWVKMGCYDRKLSDWDDNFWNNNSEFPNDNSLKSNLRLMAFNTAKAWLETQGDDSI